MHSHFPKHKEPKSKKSKKIMATGINTHPRSKAETFKEGLAIFYKQIEEVNSMIKLFGTRGLLRQSACPIPGSITEASVEPVRALSGQPSLQVHVRQNNYLVLWHTKGRYVDDWTPMSHIPGHPERIKWNGQNKHGDDHLLIEHEQRRKGGREIGIVLSRDKSGPFTLKAVFSGIRQETHNPIGTADRFIWNKVHTETVLGHNIGDILNEVPGISGYKWRNSALNRLGLERISGGIISGIQLCKRI